MFIPAWLLVLACLLVAVFAAWAWRAMTGRNPLPFPDPGSRIFAAASAEAKDAVVALLALHGLKERFQVDSSAVRRSILWDGTIVNVSSPEVSRKLGNAAASIGLVVDDPVASAHAAAEFLRARGFSADVVLDAEPELPIAFVVTDAMTGTALNFRKHVIHMPRTHRVRAPRSG
jgi:hypothetical protein